MWQSLMQESWQKNGTVADVFASPKSRAAKKLVFQGDQKVAIMKSRRCIRIVFTKNSSFEPVIANMVLECRASVNILMADTQDIGGIGNRSDDSAASGGKSDRRQDDCVSERKKSYSRGVEGLMLS